MNLDFDNMEEAIEEHFNRKGRKFEITRDREDAILYYNFSEGIYHGVPVSEMMITKDGRKTLKWMMTKTFPKRLIKIIKKQHDEYLDRKRRLEKRHGG